MVDYSYLLGVLGGSTGSISTGTTGTSAPAIRKQPTPPWTQAAADPPKPNELVRAALSARKLINEDGAKLDLAGASADYKKLFALYQGLDSLTALANRATAKGVAATELAALQKRFATGMQEVSGWLTSAGFDGLRVVEGTTAATSKTSATVRKDAALSTTAALFDANVGAANPVFDGQVRFDIRIGTSTGGQTIRIDLDEMGSTPRSLLSVIDFVNGKLEAAGVQTRLDRELVRGEARTVKAGTKTVTLPSGPDRYALAIRSASNETVSFQPVDISDAVYVTQGVGTAGGQQVLKFQADGGASPEAAARLGEDFWVDGRVSQTALPPGVAAVKASATGPDGSVWMVAELTAGVGGSVVKGQRDVSLLKLDSAGRVVVNQALGAAESASGFALNVGTDGRVAVAGSVTGALEPGQSGDAARVADSFVSVFAADGTEQWTQRRGAKAADEATSVGFGADGVVYVAGRAMSGIPGAASLGGWDGYLQTFKETQAHELAPIKPMAMEVQQFGTAGDDGVSAMTVNGADLYSAGEENGRLIVRRYTLDGEGRPTLAATRDLGGFAFGEVAGIAVSNGQVVVSGATRNDALDVATTLEAHHGGTDAFVAVIAGDLTATAGDRVTYVGGAGNDGAADVKVIDGKAWITGIADRAEGAKATDPTRSYLSRLDVATGAVEWRSEWSGTAGQASATTLTVARNGASVLDRLGLPQGEIAKASSQKLVDALGLRPGDRFTVSPEGGGRATTVTIDARDTLQTLARKIELASNRKLKVTVSSVTAADLKQGEAGQAIRAGAQQLTITARDGETGAVLTAGEPGRDALVGLGLSQGYIGKTTGTDVTKTYGLNLSQKLNLNDADAAKTAAARLGSAMTALRSAYRGLSPDAARAAAASGPVPEYLTSQLANYQAALQRLGG